MRIIIAQKNETIQIGKKGQNKATSVDFDCTEWLKDYPNGSIGLYVTKPNATESYPATLLTVSSGFARWTVINADLSTVGYGSVELMLTNNDQVVKSVTYDTQTLNSTIDDSAEAPSGWSEYVSSVVASGNLAKTSADTAVAKAKEAKESASSALSSRIAANSSESTAVSKASVAINKAKQASDYATTATQKATEASASASTASAKATQASTSASNALSYKEQSATILQTVQSYETTFTTQYNRIVSLQSTSDDVTYIKGGN